MSSFLREQWIRHSKLKKKKGLRELIKWLSSVKPCSNKTYKREGCSWFRRTWRDSKDQAFRRVSNLGRPIQKEVHLESSNGTTEDVSSCLWWLRKALKDIEYGGYLIPKGRQVSKSFVSSMLSHYILLFETIIKLKPLYFDIQIFWAMPMTHMDSNIFPELSKFDPSRFENHASVPLYSVVAFGGGTRTCPRYEFARIETLVTSHSLVTRFTWKLCADNSFSRDLMPVPTQGLPIKLVPRKLC